MGISVTANSLSRLLEFVVLTSPADSAHHAEKVSIAPFQLAPARVPGNEVAVGLTRAPLAATGEGLEVGGGPKQQEEDTCLAGVLRAVWQHSGETQSALAASIGLRTSTLQNWLSGRSAPTSRHDEVIKRLEQRCGMRPGALRELIKTRSRRGRAPNGRYRGIDDGRSLRDRISRNLTAAEMRLPQEQFRARYELAKAAVTACTPRQFRPEVLQRRLETTQAFTVPAQLDAELALYRQLSQLAEVDVTVECLPLPQRRDGGFQMQQDRLLSVMRHLATEHRCPPERLSLAMLLFPRLAQLAVGAKQQRMVQTGATDTVRLSATDVATFAAARALVAPRNGFIYQRKEMFLARLTELPDLVTPEMINQVGLDWHGACAAAADRYEDLGSAFRQFVVSTIDRKAPVDALLRQGDPLAGLNMLNERLAQACRSADPAFSNFDQLAAYAVQARISSDCALRATTLSLLELGDLVEGGDGWRLDVPRQKFKNPDGPYFRLHGGRFRDFERTLSCDHGIGDIIETYLCRVRPKLPGARASTRLFLDVANRPSDRRASSSEIGAKTLSRRSKIFTGRFVCGPDGIPGLAPFGVHNFRDVLATGTLKATGDLKAAADAICDSVDIVLAHYVRYWRSDASNEGERR